MFDLVSIAISAFALSRSRLLFCMADNWHGMLERSLYLEVRVDNLETLRQKGFCGPPKCGNSPSTLFLWNKKGLQTALEGPKNRSMILKTRPSESLEASNVLWWSATALFLEVWISGILTAFGAPRQSIFVLISQLGALWRLFRFTLHQHVTGKNSIWIRIIVYFCTSMTMNSAYKNQIEILNHFQLYLNILSHSNTPWFIQIEFHFFPARTSLAGWPNENHRLNL